MVFLIVSHTFHDRNDDTETIIECQKLTSSQLQSINFGLPRNKRAKKQGQDSYAIKAGPDPVDVLNRVESAGFSLCSIHSNEKESRFIFRDKGSDIERLQKNKELTIIKGLKSLVMELQEQKDAQDQKIKKELSMIDNENAVVDLLRERLKQLSASHDKLVKTREEVDHINMTLKVHVSQLQNEVNRLRPVEHELKKKTQALKASETLLHEMHIKDEKVYNMHSSLSEKHEKIKRDKVELAAKKEQLESQLAHALEKSKKLAEEVKVKSKQLVDAQLAKTKDSIEIETLQKNLKLQAKKTEMGMKGASMDQKKLLTRIEVLQKEADAASEREHALKLKIADLEGDSSARSKMEEAQKATIKQLHVLQLKYDELDLEKSRLLGVKLELEGDINQRKKNTSGLEDKIKAQEVQIQTLQAENKDLRKRLQDMIKGGILKEAQEVPEDDKDPHLDEMQNHFDEALSGIDTSARKIDIEGKDEKKDANKMNEDFFYFRGHQISLKEEDYEWEVDDYKAIFDEYTDELGVEELTPKQLSKVLVQAFICRHKAAQHFLSRSGLDDDEDGIYDGPQIKSALMNDKLFGLNVDRLISNPQFQEALERDDIDYKHLVRLLENLATLRHTFLMDIFTDDWFRGGDDGLLCFDEFLACGRVLSSLYEIELEPCI